MVCCTLVCLEIADRNGFRRWRMDISEHGLIDQLVVRSGLDSVNKVLPHTVLDGGIHGIELCVKDNLLESLAKRWKSPEVPELGSRLYRGNVCD